MMCLEEYGCRLYLIERSWVHLKQNDRKSSVGFSGKSQQCQGLLCSGLHLKTAQASNSTRFEARIKCIYRGVSGQD
jgi:hypothetical protein